MRAERVIFLRDAQSRHGLIDFGSEPCEFVPGLKPHPEHTRGLRSREESIAAKADLYGCAVQVSQSFSDLFHLGRSFFADKLQSHMQRFRSYPAGILGELPHAIHEARDTLSDLIFEVEGDKDAHGIQWIV